MKQKKSRPPLTPQKYIATRARTLPIYTCLINQEWKESGMASIAVVRKHTNGNYALGVYLVDLFALGTKNTFFMFNINEIQYQKFKNEVGAQLKLQISYELAHSIIYGANSFAKLHGFRPTKEFELTQFILEAESEKIKLIDIEFGENGKPLVISGF